jgi:hypothetical protein
MSAISAGCSITILDLRAQKWMTSDPASATNSHESAIPVLEWEPNGYMYRVVLSRMRVCHCDIAEIQVARLNLSKWRWLYARVMIDLMSGDIDDLSSKNVRLPEDFHRTSIHSGLGNSWIKRCLCLQQSQRSTDERLHAVSNL